MALAIAGSLLLLSLVHPRTSAAQAPAADLPDGPGKAVLLSACTTCHELTEVTKFKGYYTKDEWRDIVVTMVKYGAVVKNDDVPVLIDYLFKNFGKKD
jgi:cytochrome c5